MIKTCAKVTFLSFLCLFEALPSLVSVLVRIAPFCENVSVYLDLSAEYARHERYAIGEDKIDSDVQDHITKLETFLRLVPYEREFQEEMSK